MSDDPYFRELHRREAARLQSLAATATTSAMKSRLLDEAEKHARLARGEPPAEDETRQ